MNGVDIQADGYAIEVKRLIKSYGEHHALRGIDLSVKWGDILAIFGPNGAGKTTLLKVLATLVKPSSGDVSVAGFNLKQDAIMIRRRIGVVTHQTLLYDDLSAYENLRFYGKMYDVSNLRDRINQLVAQVGLESRIHDPVRTLSRGMQQRLAIARALIHDPPVLLLDEPGTGLDQHASAMFANILNSTVNKQRAVLITSHSLEQGAALSNRIAIMADGKIAYEGSKQLDISNLREVYYQCTGVK
ncbi:MAG: heme ABC exporter ATP-binding protein CcmA, partial [Dehalococcoidia bacterium]|nr:heme ABC exporter ATP-binding protein CcmA [Dehalococcoidia bacterium]